MDAAEGAAGSERSTRPELRARSVGARAALRQEPCCFRLCTTGRRARRRQPQRSAAAGCLGSAGHPDRRRQVASSVVSDARDKAIQSPGSRFSQRRGRRGGLDVACARRCGLDAAAALVDRACVRRVGRARDGVVGLANDRLLAALNTLACVRDPGHFWRWRTCWCSQPCSVDRFACVGPHWSVGRCVIVCSDIRCNIAMVA